MSSYESTTKGKSNCIILQKGFCIFNLFISKFFPKNVKIALDHSDWVQEMQEELNEFEQNKVWRLILTPKDVYVIGLKWFFRKKLEKEGNVIRNKAR